MISKIPGRSALEELRLELESISNLMQRHPKLFLIHAEISLRTLREPVIGKEIRNIDRSST